MRRRAFTLIELMVVVLIIGLLISILLPSLGKAMEAARKMQCAANLSGFGKTFKIYASENEGAYPALEQGKKFDGTTDMGVASGIDTQTSLWLMVTSELTSPETFICPSDRGAVAFMNNADDTLASVDKPFPNVDSSGVEDVNGTKRSWSYSYQIPNGDSGNPGRENPKNTRFALMADRAPFDADLRITGETTIKEANRILQTLPDETNYPDQRKEEFNSPNHGGSGQNVLYQDGHVKWRNSPWCGIQNDNIYTRATGTTEQTRIQGEKVSTDLTKLPYNDDDSVLCNVIEGVVCTDPADTTGGGDGGGGGG